MPYPYNALPNTQHSVFYSYAVTVGSGAQIGSFEKFSSTFSRTAERIREVYFSRGAQTKEIVWAGTDIQVSIDHVELYQTSILQALGFQIYTIEDLNQTLHIHEMMFIPNSPVQSSNTEDPGSANTEYRLITYEDCVATAASKEINIGTARIVESMTFECRTVTGQNLPVPP